MFYLGLELSTLPLAALAAFDTSKRISSEAGIKLILSATLASLHSYILHKKGDLFRMLNDEKYNNNRFGTAAATKNTMEATMANIMEKVTQYKSEIALAALYVYVAILAIATLKELGIV